MRDRIETAKNYDSGNKVKELAEDRARTANNAAAGIATESRPNGKEMPERIRINSQPLLAILSEIADEKWGTEPKVMLRPYKLLVTHEQELRTRLKVLEDIWKRRPKPDDVTKPAGEIGITFQPETLEDGPVSPNDDDSLYRGPYSISSSALSHERQVRRKQDLTTTYDALNDLKILIEFLDIDVMPVVEQYSQNSTYPKIHFRDLWYL